MPVLTQKRRTYGSRRAARTRFPSQVATAPGASISHRGAVHTFASTVSHVSRNSDYAAEYIQRLPEGEPATAPTIRLYKRGLGGRGM
jgi:hypothetical protein